MTKLHVYANPATEWYVAESAADALAQMLEMSGESPEDYEADEFEECDDDAILKIRFYDESDLPSPLPENATVEPRDGARIVSATYAAWVKQHGRGFLCTDLD